MGGQIDFAALPILSEVLGFQDVEILLDQLTQLRDRDREE